MRTECLLDLLALTAAQQPVVHEHTREAITDGPVHQCGGDRRIDAAGQAANGASLGADQLADPADFVIDEVPGRPVRYTATDVEEKVVQDLAAARRMGNLRVEQHSVDRLLLVLHSGDGRVGARGRDAEMRRRLIHAVAMTRPHDRRRARLESREQSPVLANRDLGATVLPLTRGHDLAAGEPGDELHPVANAKDRDTEIQDRRICGRRTLVEHGIRTARENDAFGVERPDEGEVQSLACGVDLAVDARFADTPRDQLRELRPVVEDEDAVHALYQVVGSAVSPRTRSSSVSRWRAT